MCLLYIRLHKKATIFTIPPLDIFSLPKMHFLYENTFFYPSTPPSNSTLPSPLDCYQLPLAANEPTTSRTKASLPLQYPDFVAGTSTSDESSNQSIPEQEPTNLSHQPTSFTYILKYYVRRKHGHKPTKDNTQEIVSRPSTKNFPQAVIPLAL